MPWILTKPFIRYDMLLDKVEGNQFPGYLKYFIIANPPSGKSFWYGASCTAGSFINRVALADLVLLAEVVRMVAIRGKEGARTITPDKRCFLPKMRAGTRNDRQKTRPAESPLSKETVYPAPVRADRTRFQQFKATGCPIDKFPGFTQAHIFREIVFLRCHPLSEQGL